MVKCIRIGDQIKDCEDQFCFCDTEYSNVRFLSFNDVQLFYSWGSFECTRALSCGSVYNSLIDYKAAYDLAYNVDKTFSKKDHIIEQQDNLKKQIDKLEYQVINNNIKHTNKTAYLDGKIEVLEDKMEHKDMVEEGLYRVNHRHSQQNFCDAGDWFR